MSEELKWAIGITLGVVGSGFGVLGFFVKHSFNKFESMRDNLPKDYRSKDDCGTICAAFRTSIDRQTTTIDTGFKDMRKDVTDEIRRIYDKLDGKEDKHT